MKEDKIENLIFTIGHSNHPQDEFMAMLKPFSISTVVDIRNFPGSKRYPHFNKENLERSLPENHIGYLHFKDLGGRRKPVSNSINTRWRNTAFRGYADYMETEAFKRSISILQEIALKETVAYMCSEAVWWSCHRALISDYLKIRGWKVMHIMAIGKATEHPYTSAE
jgi:uncharacterized protein (DUF488 family)